MNDLALSGVFTIIIVVVALIAAAVIGSIVVRNSKGKIELAVAKNGYNSGETIQGTVVLTTKKSLELNRLFVSLVGYQITEHRDSDGDKKTDRDEIYRQEVDLLPGQTLPTGFNQTFNYEMVAPGPESVTGSNSRSGSGISFDLGPLSIGTGSGHSRLEWKVQARADLPGLDLSKSRGVRVNVA